MSRSRLSRRAMLCALGVGAAFMPLLQAESAPAQAGGFPKRLITVTWGNGLVPDDFYPSGNTITIGETLKPLEAWADKLIVIEGLDLKVMTDYPDLLIPASRCVTRSDPPSTRSFPPRSPRRRTCSCR